MINSEYRLPQTGSEAAHSDAFIARPFDCLIGDPMVSLAQVDSTVSVNEIIRRFPATMAVFNRLGIDACCGGSASLDEAADRDGVDRATLVEALRAAISAAS